MGTLLPLVPQTPGWGRQAASTYPTNKKDWDLHLFPFEVPCCENICDLMDWGGSSWSDRSEKETTFLPLGKEVAMRKGKSSRVTQVRNKGQVLNSAEQRRLIQSCSSSAHKNSTVGPRVTPVSPATKCRLREVKKFAQSRSASRWLWAGTWTPSVCDPCISPLYSTYQLRPFHGFPPL